MECDICGRNENECKIKKIKEQYLCQKHVTQWYRHGKFSKRTIYDKNEYILHDDFAEIVLRDKNQIDVGHALIDIEDVEKCSKFKWHLRK